MSNLQKGEIEQMKKCHECKAFEDDFCKILCGSKSAYEDACGLFSPKQPTQYIFISDYENESSAILFNSIYEVVEFCESNDYKEINTHSRSKIPEILNDGGEVHLISSKDNCERDEFPKDRYIIVVKKLKA